MSAARPHPDARARLLAAAGRAAANRSWDSGRKPPLPLSVVLALRTVLVTAIMDPVRNSVDHSLAGAVLPQDPHSLSHRRIRQEGWYAFAFGIGIPTLIR
ncbi:MAG: hypothetical protein A2Z37_17255 [Chloroflexi bacterium RBG_19FT_COMBO_62_14]|nr:MAG: hypothetical protein A2Z37_17255 [Chloroflexi bacterium RBG_19FT_COMBO_62_14]